MSLDKLIPKPAPQQAVSVRDLIQRPDLVSRFKELLGERGARTFMSTILSNASTLPSNTDPMSIIACGMQAALLRLPVNRETGKAFIISYGGVAQLQIGYKGWIALALRTKQFKNINATEIYEGELVHFDRLRARITLDQSKRVSDKVIGYAALFETHDGLEHHCYWTVEQVMAHAGKYSSAFKNKRKDSPWLTNPDAMGKKTVLRDLIIHWAPTDEDMDDLSRAQSADHGTRRSLDGIEYDHINPQSEFPDNPQTATVSAPVFGSPIPALLGDGQSIPSLMKLRELMTKDKVSEAQVITAMRKAGVIDDSLDSLDSIFEYQPSAIEAATNDWKALAARAAV